MSIADDEDTADMFKSYILAHGYTVQIATDGRLGLAKMELVSIVYRLIH